MDSSGCAVDRYEMFLIGSFGALKKLSVWADEQAPEVGNQVDLDEPSTGLLGIVRRVVPPKGGSLGKVVVERL